MQGLQNIMRKPPKESPNWARYLLCPQCRRIMSNKRSKAREVSTDIWIHASCYPAFVRDALLRARKQIESKMQEEVLKKAEQEHETPGPQAS